MNKLMVIVHFRLSDIVTKGEVTSRYFNPGEVFDEVHIVMINDDVPDGAAVQRMVGKARFFLYNVPAGASTFVRTLGWRPWLLRGFARRAVAIAREVRPAMIRCYGAHLNGFVAARIKAELGIPYLVSVHTEPREPARGRVRDWKESLIHYMYRGIERTALLNADLVMPVYRAIEGHLRRLGVARYEVCYNVLSPEHLREKTDYRLHSPVRVISVGRQLCDKNPDNLIRSIATLHDVELTLVGDGPYHDYLRGIAKEAGVEDRVVFRRSVPNDALCAMLPDFDIFAVHTEHWELSKSVLEPLLSGLPIVINRRAGKAVPELTDDICVLVENSAEGYRSALSQLIADSERRELLGRTAYRTARDNWAPAATEAKFADIYSRYRLAH